MNNMKIGEIAKIAGIPINAIRYYINLGLLIPKSKNKQYVFSEEDLQDLQTIIKLKTFHFSLNDIHKIISLKRISNLADRGDIEDYLRFFIDQKNELQQQKKELETAINGLKQEISNIQTLSDNHSCKTGVPLVMLDKIYCPHCQKPLTLKDAYIENQYILSGEFFCNCGYHATIKDGILCTTGGYISPYDYPDLERSFYKNIPAAFISTLQKSYNWLLDHIAEAKPAGKVFFEDHMNAYVFSYRHIELMEKNAQYILADKYFEIVKMYKERIDKLNLNLNILYIADATFELPLKNQCVDCFIDFFSSNEYMFFNHRYLLNTIDRYFHSGTKIFGTYFYFKPGSQSMKQAMLDYPETWEKNFDLPSFKKYFLEQHHYDLIDEEPIGNVTDSGNNEAFSFHQKGEEMYLHSYEW